MQTLYKIIEIRRLLLYFFSLLVFCGCKKLVEVDAPDTSSNSANVYSSDATAAAVLTGIYAKMSSLNSNYSSSIISPTGISIATGLSADELTLYNLNSTTLLPYYKNDLTSNISNNFWSILYPIIFTANSAIEGLNNSNALTPAVKQQLLGEAKFIRAFAYFYLVNLYGNVPLVLNTNYSANTQMTRTSKTEVYQQIIADLVGAKNLLNANYLNSDALTVYPAGSEERVRPTKWAASALLGRVYLYTGDWTDAEAEASAVINNSTLYGLTSLSDVFKMNSKETIWALQPVGSGTQANTGEGALFILPVAGPNNSNYPVYLSNNIVNSFEPGDQRKVNWTENVVVGTKTYYYPYKYKVGNVSVPTSEYIIVLRLAEQYLIRAEARTQKGTDISSAVSDLNIIRSRAGLSSTGATTQSALLSAILHERQVELFTEWGHRWFDLQRLNKIDSVMNIVAPQKGGAWSDNKKLYPVPAAEISLDPNLDQNPDY
jgi:hypothetical protein